MARLHVVKVFVGAAGSGNPLGVFLHGHQVRDEVRQAVAARLGFSETVYVDDARAGRVRIFAPEEELPFAGHPLVGCAWVLRREGIGAQVLRPPAGEVPTWQEADLSWIRARSEWAPPFELRQAPAPAEVDAHAGDERLLDLWAWEDEARGQVRARVFLNTAGITEDEATGSAALKLAAALGRPLTIHQGRGSLIQTRPAGGGLVDIGGRVELVEVEDFRLG